MEDGRNSERRRRSSMLSFLSGSVRVPQVRVCEHRRSTLSTLSTLSTFTLSMILPRVCSCHHQSRRRMGPWVHWHRIASSAAAAQKICLIISGVVMETSSTAQTNSTVKAIVTHKSMGCWLRCHLQMILAWLPPERLCGTPSIQRWQIILERFSQWKNQLTIMQRTYDKGILTFNKP